MESVFPINEGWVNFQEDTEMVKKWRPLVSPVVSPGWWGMMAS